MSTSYARLVLVSRAHIDLDSVATSSDFPMRMYEIRRADSSFVGVHAGMGRPGGVIRDKCSAQYIQLA